MDIIDLKMTESIDELAAAHAGFLGDVSDVGKGSRGYGYTYADLAAILTEARPFLSKNGLSLTQFPSFSMYPPEMRVELPADSKGFKPVLIGEVTVTTTLAHKSGQWIQGVLQIPVETMKNLSVAQAVGAATSYGRRYHAAAILAIAQEDNDAARPREDSPQGRQQGNQPARQPQRAQSKPTYDLITAGDADALRTRIVKMGRNPDQFAAAVAGVKRLADLPVNALEAAQKMLAKAEAKHYAEQKAAEQGAASEASAAQSAEENADQTVAYSQHELDEAARQNVA